MHSHNIHQSTGVTETRTQTNGSGKVWFAAAAVLLLAAFVPFGAPLVESAVKPVDDMAFSASDTNGRMRVTWNRNSTLVDTADSARLDVVDGANSATYPVEVGVLRSGTLEYLRHSDDVLLTLTMLREGRPVHREMIRSIGSDSSAPARNSRSRTR